MRAAAERALLPQLRQAGGAVWLWLAVAGLWSTVSAAHESGFVLLIALALLAAALPGGDRQLLTIAAIWTVLAGAVTWQPGLGLGTLLLSVLAVLVLRLIAWPAWQQAGTLAAAGGSGGDSGRGPDTGSDRGPDRSSGRGRLGNGRAVAVAFVAGSLMYMLTGASPVASWGMFLISAAIGGLVWYFRRHGPWAAAASLVGGWLLNLAGDVLITDQLWQGVLFGARPGLAWGALAASVAGASWLIGIVAALPQAGLDWPVVRQGASPDRATMTGSAATGMLHRGTIVWAMLFAAVALFIPEFGATWLRAADGGVWAASLLWWGLAVLLRGRLPLVPQRWAVQEGADVGTDGA